MLRALAGTISSPGGGGGGRGAGRVGGGGGLRGPRSTLCQAANTSPLAPQPAAPANMGLLQAGAGHELTAPASRKTAR